MRHDLESSAIEFHNQGREIMRFIDQRRNQAGGAVGKEFDKIGRHPFVMIESACLLEVQQKLWRQPMRHGDRTERGTGANREVSALTQLREQPNLCEIAR